MSAFGPKIDMSLCAVHVRYWPKADIGYCTAHVRFWGKADIGLPQTYRYPALSVAVLIVKLCKLGAAHMAVGVVLSATFWIHICEERVADAHQSAWHNVQSPLTVASRRRPALRA